MGYFVSRLNTLAYAYVDEGVSLELPFLSIYIKLLEPYLRCSYLSTSYKTRVVLSPSAGTLGIEMRINKSSIRFDIKYIILCPNYASIS